MIRPMIDSSYAWQLIRDARTRDWGQPQCWRVADRASLRVAPGGAWDSDADVDAEAIFLLDTLLPVVAVSGTCVIGQLGQSLDGRIATASGHSHYVTGETSRVHLHRLRALVDAVIVGAGTAAADNPQLTVRHAEGENPVRVVLDPCGRVPASQRLFKEGPTPTLHVLAAGRPHPVAAHVEPLWVPECGPAGVPPRSLLALLAARGLRRVLVEGGGLTVSRFLDADAFDRLHVVVAPLLIGSGRPALSLPEIDSLQSARRPVCSIHRLGDDVLFDLAFTPGIADGS